MDWACETVRTGPGAGHGLALLMAAACLTGCDAAVDVVVGRHAEAEQLVRSTFDEQNPPGRVAIEVLGKGVWYRAPTLSGSCLQQKEWAFNNDPRRTKDASGKGMARISPIYSAQNSWIDITDQGYCIYIGSDATLDVLQSTYLDGAYRVEVELGMKGPGGWWDCVDSGVKKQTVSVVEADDGSLEVVGGRVGVGWGDCAAPAPLGDTRKALARPRGKAPRLPSKADINALVATFDSKLGDGDYHGALQHVRCFNLFEESKFGSCSAGELVGLAAIPSAGGEEPFEPPWTDAVFTNTDGFGRIFADKLDKNMAHVEIEHRRTGDKRTMALYWMDNAWHLVGVVSLKGEGLTSMRFVYDLDRKDRRDIFERRLEGEMIDEKGFPYDPFAAENAEGG